ncbi:hypothetical protein CCP3SC5AM1_200018 [Gammaproteobacteria bacterium]
MTPINTQSIFIEAERLAASGHYRAALSLLDTLPSPVEDPVRAGLLRGRILVQQGQFDAAIDHWRAVQSIQPDNQEIQQAMELAMEIKDRPSRLILLRANLHLAIQYLVILLLGGIVLVQAIQSYSSASIRMEAVLDNFHEVDERRITALEKHLEGLEKAITIMGTAIQTATTTQKEPFREIVERLAALEQAVALERESIRALGARQEERITALGMVMGELGTRFSQSGQESTPAAQTSTSPTH